MKLPNFLKKKAEDPEIKAAREAAYRKGALERAAQEGYRTGKNKPKTFIDKLGGFGENLSKNLGGTGGGGGFDMDFLIGGSTSKRRTTKKRRKRK